MSRILRNTIIVLILASTVGCDQLSKHIVRRHVEYYEQIGLIPNYFTLTKVENTGAFLSLGNSLPAPLKLALLVILPLLALGFAMAYLFTQRNLSTTRILGICFIVGGGIGNIYDRLMYGSVTDFLHINFGFFETGIFNIADVAVMLGVFIVFLDSYLARHNELGNQEQRSSSSPDASEAENM